MVLTIECSVRRRDSREWIMALMTSSSSCCKAVLKTAVMLRQEVAAPKLLVWLEARGFVAAQVAALLELYR